MRSTSEPVHNLVLQQRELYDSESNRSSRGKLHYSRRSHRRSISNDEVLKFHHWQSLEWWVLVDIILCGSYDNSPGNKPSQRLVWVMNEVTEIWDKQSPHEENCSEKADIVTESRNLCPICMTELTTDNEAFVTSSCLHHFCVEVGSNPWPSSRQANEALVTWLLLLMHEKITW